MNPEGDGFAAAVLPAERRGRLRGRPSGLKGRYRDRYSRAGRAHRPGLALIGPGSLRALGALIDRG
ncbi:hypothetical protein, partial [Mycobacterium canetti]|uniref:hypothetical protein n=1 Tax=Mycobacterium canetti TaxID=78331 RepID=UPI001E5E8578